MDDNDGDTKVHRHKCRQIRRRKKRAEGRMEMEHQDDTKVKMIKIQKETNRNAEKNTNKSRMEMEHQVDIKVTMMKIKKYTNANAEKIKTRAGWRWNTRLMDDNDTTIESTITCEQGLRKCIPTKISQI